MIKWLFKYSAVIFVFNPVLLSIGSTIFLGKIVFFVLMSLYAIVLLINLQQIKNVIFHNSFLFLLLINILNISYFLIFHSFFDLEAINYLLARGMQFSILSVSIYFSYEYYKTQFLDHFIYFAAFIVLIGIVVDPYLFSGRYSGITWNPNMLSSLVTLAFAVLFLKNKRYSKFDYGLLFLFLVVALATGSRGSLLAIILAYFMKYGFLKRNILYGFFALIAGLILMNLPFDTSVNRFASQSIFNDRILQYQFALESIYNKIFIGYGLDKYSYIDMSLVPWHLKAQVKGAHNGYLAILTQYGLIFGFLVIFIILRKSIQVINYFKKYIGVERAYLFIIVYALLAATYESLITGINELHTSLFWFSLAFLSFSKFHNEFRN